MIVVSDTGPIISLAVIGKLDLLEGLGYRVVIPEAVWFELERVINEADIPQAMRFRDQVIKVSRREIIDSALGPGETEAIILYEGLHADRLFIEDNAGRLCAEARGIRCTGTLGVLMEARKKNLIPALRPIFTALLEHNRYFGLPLLNRILEDSGETPL